MKQPTATTSQQQQVECWTLISTPQFAIDEITHEPMQDGKTGAFKPQDDGYLNSGPAPALLKAFESAIVKLRQQQGQTKKGKNATTSTWVKPPPPPQVLYLQGQRWGSALPAPSSVGGRDDLGKSERIVRLMEVDYEGGTPMELVYAATAAQQHSAIALTLPRPSLLLSTHRYPRPKNTTGAEEAGVLSSDYLVDEDLMLFYAGDFVSRRNPGFEAASLSGLDAAVAIARSLAAKGKDEELGNTSLNDYLVKVAGEDAGSFGSNY